MAREHTAHVEIMICGLPREVCVVFEVESYGSDGGFGEFPESPSIVINDVRNNDYEGRSIYDLCEQYRDIWAAPRYASGIWQITHGGPRSRFGVPREEPAWCHIAFNASYGSFHSLLDTLYEVVLSDHMPEQDGDDYYADCDREPTIYHFDTRTEHDV